MQRKDDIMTRFNLFMESEIGLSMKEMEDYSAEEICQHIERQNGKTLDLDKNNDIDYRGSMLLAMGKIDYDIDTEFDKRFAK